MPPEPAARPAAVLWDMDGTLVDTEPYWIAEEFDLVESFGGEWSLEHAHALVGGDLLWSARYIRAHSPVTLEPEAVVDRLLRGVSARMRERVPWRPGARELLTQLGDAGVPCALVTSSWRPVAQCLLDVLPPATFQAVVTGEEVTQGKPGPEPYLTAAAALGHHPGDCVAIEDSVNGVRSARSAGTRTLVVPNAVPVPQEEGGHRLTTLAGVTVTDLARLTESTPG